MFNSLKPVELFLYLGSQIQRPVLKHSLFFWVFFFHPCTGILRGNGTIDNEASIQRLAEVAVAYAKAGTI